MNLRELKAEPLTGAERIATGTAVTEGNVKIAIWPERKVTAVMVAVYCGVYPALVIAFC